MAQHAASSPAGSSSLSSQHSGAWVGWIAFAGTMMIMLGGFHIIQGLVALFNDKYFLVGSSGLVLSLDFTTWGWIHLVAGVVVVVAGVCVFAGQVWARTVGVVVAMLSALLNLGFLAAYPVWALILIALDVVVIMALTVHGSDIKNF
jgi:hypothetical protein